MDENIKKRILIILTAIAIAAFILTIVMCAKEPPLPAYDASNDVEVITQTAEPSWGEIYTDGNTGISFRVPKDFTHVVKDGKETFIHAATAAYYQITAVQYNPGILNEDSTTLSQELSAAGGTLLDYSAKSQFDYTFSYQVGNEVFLQRTVYDQVKICTIAFSCDEQYFDSFATQAKAAIDSVSFDTRYAFPDDVVMYYSTFGNFQFAIPKSWEAVAQGDAIVAADPVSGTEMMISATNVATSFEGYTQVDYVNAINASYTRYIPYS